jgi:hypothetical protein
LSGGGARSPKVGARAPGATPRHFHFSAGTKTEILKHKNKIAHKQMKNTNIAASVLLSAKQNKLKYRKYKSN